VTNERDFLYHNDGGRFTDVNAAPILTRGATHGVQWVDFDRDGDLDLALANNNPTGAHPLYRNLLPPEIARRSLQVMVLNEQGRATRAGAVRVFAAGTRRLLGTALLDTGGGYCSQNVAPVHVGLPSMSPVDVEVTTLTPGGRNVTRVAGVTPGTPAGGILTVRAPAGGPGSDRQASREAVSTGERSRPGGRAR